MAGHTPGPWAVSEAPNSFARVTGPTEYADALVADCKSQYRTHEEQAANARLIAAAPDMLEALKAIIAITGADDNYPEGPAGNTSGCVGIDSNERMVWKGSFLERLENARSVIQKAEGNVA